MGFEDLLVQTASAIKKVTSYDNSNQPVYSQIYSNVRTRRESVEKLVQNKKGKEIVVTSLFYFSYLDVTDMAADYIIDFGGTSYTVVRADLLLGRTAPHHWECYAN